MTFLNPLLLFGMAAVAAPIIIHLFMNRRVKPVVWAAMRFLLVSVQKNQKRMNLEDLILLALRCLLLILLALALARPMFRGAGSMVAGKGGGETAAIVIDNSYSMAVNDGSTTRFDQARQAAEQVLDSLQAGSSVAVFLFSDVVRGLIPEPTYDLNLAHKIVHDATLSNRTTNVTGALRQTLEMLSHHTSASQRIYLITDGQANGWKQFDDIGKMLHNPAVKTRIVLVGSPEDHNLSVSDLQLGSSFASVGEAAQFEVEVTNFGLSEAKDVAVRLAVDDEAPSDEGVIDIIPPGGAKRLALYTKFNTAGSHTATAQINADHLLVDDQRTIALRANDDVRVLLVSGDTGNGDPVSDATFYLRNALTPVPASERDKYVVKTKTISPGEIESTKLGDYEAVVLADVPGISAVAMDALAAYLNRGGGLVIFPGPKTDPSFFNENLSKKFDFLPATFGALRGKPDQHGAFFTLQEKGYEHRIVSIWNDPAAGTLGTAHFYCAYELKPETGHTAKAGEPRVVVKYADGTPAVMERTWGRGRVILFSSTANSAWNDLPLHPVYLPLMDRMLGSILDRQEAQFNITVGSPFELVCDADWVGKDALVRQPGEKDDSGSLRRIEMVNELPFLRFDITDLAGPYEATIKTDPPTIIKFAAQFDPIESNLAPLSPTQLDTLAQTAQIIHWTPSTRLDEQITKERGGSELWTTLITLLILLACAEVTLAGIFSASK